MIIYIILIVAFWVLYNSLGADLFPIALPILMTIFGSLGCLIQLIRGIAKIVEKKRQQKTGVTVADILNRRW